MTDTSTLLLIILFPIFIAEIITVGMELWVIIKSWKLINESVNNMCNSLETMDINGDTIITELREVVNLLNAVTEIDNSADDKTPEPTTGIGPDYDGVGHA